MIKIIVADKYALGKAITRLAEEFELDGLKEIIKIADVVPMNDATLAGFAAQHSHPGMIAQTKAKGFLIDLGPHSKPIRFYV